MSDKRRRLLCRIAFGLFCLLPTALVFSHILFPTTGPRWQSRIESRLGMTTSIESIATPTPFKTVLSGVVASADVKREVLPITFPRIEIVHRSNESSIQLEPLRAQSSAIVQLLSRSFARLLRDQEKLPTGRITCPSITIEQNLAGNASLELLDVAIQIETDGTSPRITATFKTTVDQELPIRCELSRLWSGSDWVNQMRVQTNGTPLPCWLLRDVWPSLRRLGNKATFDGQLSVDTIGEETIVDVRQCRLSQVDLKSLVQVPFQQPLTGTAEIRIDSMQLKNGTVQVMLLSVSCTQGTIGTELANAANVWLGIATVDLPKDTIVGFYHLAIIAEIRDAQLHLWNGHNDDRIASFGDGNPLAQAGEKSLNLPPTALFNCLAPETRLQGPVSTAAKQLISILPDSKLQR